MDEAVEAPALPQPVEHLLEVGVLLDDAEHLRVSGAERAEEVCARLVHGENPGHAAREGVGLRPRLQTLAHLALVGAEYAPQLHADLDGERAEAAVVVAEASAFGQKLDDERVADGVGVVELRHERGERRELRVVLREPVAGRLVAQSLDGLRLECLHLLDEVAGRGTPDDLEVAVAARRLDHHEVTIHDRLEGQ